MENFISFIPALNTNTRHTVKLYLKTPSGKITYLAADLIDSKAYKEVKMCFHVKKLWHLIKSGNSVHAWIYCSTIFEGSLVTYIGVPQEDAHVLNSPQLKGSISSNINYSVNSLDTQWLPVERAEKYQCGFYFINTSECVSISETTTCDANVSFKGQQLELLSNEHCLFKVYVVAKEKLGTGELSLFPAIFQSLKNPLIEGCEVIIFTSAILFECVWFKHIGIYRPLALFNPQHMLYPSGKPFPTINVPPNTCNTFWESQPSLFGEGKAKLCIRINLKHSFFYRSLLCPRHSRYEEKKTKEKDAHLAKTRSF